MLSQRYDCLWSITIGCTIGGNNYSPSRSHWMSTPISWVPAFEFLWNFRHVLIIIRASICANFISIGHILLKCQGVCNCRPTHIYFVNGQHDGWPFTRHSYNISIASAVYKTHMGPLLQGWLLYTLSMQCTSHSHSIVMCLCVGAHTSTL